MFKFNFNVDNESEIDKIPESNDDFSVKSSTKWVESEEVSSQNINLDIYQDLKPIINQETGIKHYDSANILQVLKKRENDCSILKAEQNHSDLIPGVYEGGLKVWECTLDLLKYITENNLKFDENTKVLDLGCGAGLIGILAAKKDATVYFQDYNVDVIKHITIPNVILNLGPAHSNCRFFSGDWGSFTELIEPDCTTDETKFDYIFTSETIYNVENYDKLHNVFRKLLKKQGKIYLAAKEYYFGVGGGIIEFRQHLQKYNLYNFEVVQECSTGVNRVILKITMKQQS